MTCGSFTIGLHHKTFEKEARLRYVSAGVLVLEKRDAPAPAYSKREFRLWNQAISTTNQYKCLVKDGLLADIIHNDVVLEIT